MNASQKCTADSRADNLLATDSNGKILVSIRNWDPEEDGLLDYNEREKFMRFLDKYVKHNINGDMLKKWKGQNRNKTLIHKLKPGDLAYVTLIYEAKMGVWAEGVQGLSREQRKATPKYQKTGKVARFGDAWDDTGREYFKKLVKEYARLWRNADFMTQLVEQWREYESKHHKRSFKRQKTSTVSDTAETEVRDDDILMDDEPDDYALVALPALSPRAGHEEV